MSHCCALLSHRSRFQVASINAEIVDFCSGLTNVTHFFLGLTNEWLDSTNDGGVAKPAPEAGKAAAVGSVAVNVKGKTEFVTLPRFSKMLVNSMPKANRVKILKMSKKATVKQYMRNLKQ